MCSLFFWNVELRTFTTYEWRPDPLVSSLVLAVMLVSILVFVFSLIRRMNLSEVNSLQIAESQGENIMCAWEFAISIGIANSNDVAHQTSLSTFLSATSMEGAWVSQSINTSFMLIALSNTLELQRTAIGVHNLRHTFYLYSYSDPLLAPFFLLKDKIGS